MGLSAVIKSGGRTKYRIKVKAIPGAAGYSDAVRLKKFTEQRKADGDRIRLLLARMKGPVNV